MMPKNPKTEALLLCTKSKYLKERYFLFEINGTLLERRIDNQNRHKNLLLQKIYSIVYIRLTDELEDGAYFPLL